MELKRVCSLSVRIVNRAYDNRNSNSVKQSAARVWNIGRLTWNPSKIETDSEELRSLGSHHEGLGSPVLESDEADDDTLTGGGSMVEEMPVFEGRRSRTDG